MSTEDPLGLSLVAVIRVDTQRAVSDLDRFLALAVPSFRRFLDPGLVNELIVIVPSADVARTKRRLEKAWTLPNRVIDENELVPKLQGEVAGWIRQQILKLAAYSIVQTPWFITLDADVVAVRPVDRGFLFPSQRAIWQQEGASAHLDWWRASAKFLRSPTVVHPDEPVFGVTPAIMHTASLRSLAGRISGIHSGKHWTQSLGDLADEGWTEYTLYWTHILDSGTASQLYDNVGSDHRPYTLDGSVWLKEQLSLRADREQLDEVFASNGNHAFFVFQSNLDQPLVETVRSLRPYLDGTDHIAFRERLRWAMHVARFRFLWAVNGIRTRTHKTVDRAWS